MPFSRIFVHNLDASIYPDVVLPSKCLQPFLSNDVIGFTDGTWNSSESTKIDTFIQSSAAPNIGSLARVSQVALLFHYPTSEYVITGNNRILLSHTRTDSINSNIVRGQDPAQDRQRMRKWTLLRVQWQRGETIQGWHKLISRSDCIIGLTIRQSQCSC